MSLTKEQQEAILKSARSLIGTKYDDLDCSHFVHRAYSLGGLQYPYRNTSAFSGLAGSTFEEVDAAKGFEPADVLIFPGHMGLWDPAGCTVLQTAKTPNAECERFDNNLPFLSSRTTDNRGPDFGMMKWFGKLKKVYRWK